MFELPILSPSGQAIPSTAQMTGYEEWCYFTNSIPGDCCCDEAPSDCFTVYDMIDHPNVVDGRAERAYRVLRNELLIRYWPEDLQEKVGLGLSLECT
jgi:hypothetical protein